MRDSSLDNDFSSFRHVVREFVNHTVKPGFRQMIESQSVSREVWESAGKLGILALSNPEKYGGSGVDDFRYNAIVTEELAAFSLGVAACFTIQVDVCARYIADLGTDEQMRRWLPGIAAGELICSIAMTEPSGGTDLSAIRTTAVPVRDGWLINGSKTFITNGNQADLVILAARTSPDGGPMGITLFVVEDGMAGFGRGRKLDKIGQREADTAELFFDDVYVPDGHRLGEVGRGFISMMRLLPQERLSIAVANVSHAAQILRETVEYARIRHGFEPPGDSSQGDRFTLAELVTKIDVTKAFLEKCVRAHSRGDLSSIDAAKVKWWSAEIQNQVLDACVQIHGQYGYIDESRVAKAWRDARVTKIWAGSNEIMKEMIGRDLGL
jgi:alkylation response protein AidB-like acyl-CoA dehydrogenase